MKHKTDEYVEGCADCVRERRFVEVNYVKIVKAARVIREVLETIDNRCMAADGPVTPTIEEIRPKELRQLYKAAVRIAEASK